jgi:AhpD family alkylhydroperoxidase
MGTRLDIRGIAPRTYATMSRLSGDSHGFGLEPLLVELVKTRASQINGCAFCVDMHTKDARAAGEEEHRLHLLVAWRECDWYSERERAALALTEAMTRLPDGHGVPDDVFTAAAGLFSDEELAGLIWAITAINAWNRIAITTRMEPGHYQPGGHE